MENRKYEGLDKSFYEEEKPTLLERISGAKKAIVGVALTAVLIGSIPIGLEIACHQNDPTQFICPITQLETKLFGYEAGLKHQAKDLEGYSYESEKNEGLAMEVTDVEFIPGGTKYVLPEGGILKENGQGVVTETETVPATKSIVVGPNGEEQVTYSVPAGYVLNGTVGVKTSEKIVEPITVTYGPKVSFDCNFLQDGKVTDVYKTDWTVESNQYVKRYR